jgi:hypothetical protein
MALFQEKGKKIKFSNFLQIEKNNFQKISRIGDGKWSLGRFLRKTTFDNPISE